MTEAQLVTWHAAPGSSVRSGETVLTIETDKAQYEVEAPCDGRLGVRRAAVGTTLRVGAVVGHVLEAGEAEPALELGGPAVADPRPGPPPSPEGGQRRRVRASPRARRIAEERGVDLEILRGSGPDGLVTERDVEAAAQAELAAPAASDAERWHGRRVRERLPLSGVRLAGARRTSEAWTTAPHFVQMVDADMSRLRALREEWKRTGDPRAAVGWNDFVVAALARALVEQPALNAAFDGDALVVFDEVNVGIAVDTPRGLVVPVLRGAERKALTELARAARELAEKARAGALGHDEVTGGTATVSNLGAFGIRAGTPVLNPPEAVLVFVGAVEERVIALAGAPAVRPLCTLSIAYDHRVADGASAARLTRRVRELLEEPTPLLA
jgi:pyruvate dehydrogenase E2 component (dihydrolipoamide acetyltransferase)